MAIYYVDYTNGNDSNDGTSFALRKKTIDSATTSRASGDEIRVMETPSGYLGTGIWKTHFESHAQLNFSSVWTTSPVFKGTITKNSHGLETGDWVKLLGIGQIQLNGYYPVTKIDNNTFEVPNPGGYSGTQSGTSYYILKVSNSVLELSNPVTKNLSCAGLSYPYYDLWQKTSSYVSITRLSYNSTNNLIPQHPYSAQLSWTSSFTTGKAAWFPLPDGPTYMGDYRQLSFYVRQSAGTGTLTPYHMSLRLCSDTTGDSPLYTFPITSPGIINNWCHQVVDCGEYMTSSIGSIALYVDRDVGAITIQLNSIIACKGPDDVDLLHQGSLVSTKRPGDVWWPIRYITDQYVLIGTAPVSNQTFSTASSVGNLYTYGYHYDNYGYSVNSTLQPVYTQHPINPFALSKNYYPNVTTITIANINSDYITLTGGWNSTDMSTRTNSDSATWFTGDTCNGRGLYMASRLGVTIENFGIDNMQNGIFGSGITNCTFENISLSHSAYGVYLTSSCFGNTFRNISVTNCTSGGIYSQLTCNENTIENVQLKANLSNNLRFNQSFSNLAKDITIHGGYMGINFDQASKYNRVIDITMKDLYLGSYVSGGGTSYNSIENVFLGSVYKITGCNGYGVSDNNFLNVSWDLNHSWDPYFPNVQDFHAGLNRGNFIQSALTLFDGTEISVHDKFYAKRDTTFADSSSSSIKISPTSTSQWFGAEPVRYRVAKVAVTGGKTVSFSVKLYRNLQYFRARIGCPPQSGVSSDYVYSNYMTAVNSWETLTISVLPTIPGVINFEIVMDSESEGSMSPYNLSPTHTLWIDSIECSES